MTLISFCILIISIIAHEVAHGVAALWQGDITAKEAGRLTLNPIPHIDLVGSILIPLLCSIGGSSIFFGWAKPVPINPYNFRNQKWGEALVAFAGPLTNILIALVFSALIQFAPLSLALTQLAATIVLINIVLAFFNLLPIPPLDGSKILFAVLPHRYHGFKRWFERNFILGIVAAILVWQLFIPLILSIYVFLVK